MSSPAPADQPRPAAPAAAPGASGAAFAPPYASPAAPALPEPPAPAAHSRAQRRRVGLVAAIVAVIALIGSVATAAVAVSRVAATATITGSLDAAGLRALSPARDWVLVGEIAFWSGTVLGLWALAQGVVAIVADRGRGLGIAAVVTAALSPVVFGVVVGTVVLVAAA